MASAQNEREHWDQARAAPRKRGSRKGKCQRRCSTSGNGLTRAIHKYVRAIVYETNG